MTIDKKYYLDGTEKVSDKVWSLDKFIATGDGECIIDAIKTKHVDYPVWSEDLSHTTLGRLDTLNKLPSLFKSNPFIPEFPKMMEVSVNEKDWLTKKVYAISIDGSAMCDFGHFIHFREIKTTPKLSEILKEKFYKDKTKGWNKEQINEYKDQLDHDFKNYLAGFKEKINDINNFENDL